MLELPQTGACLCGDVAYRLDASPLTLYACHCSDCQRQTGASFALSMIVEAKALRVTRGETRRYRIELEDGRVKLSESCGRCVTRLFAPTAIPGVALLEPGTLDDTSWLRPVAHIWTRSAQPWLAIPEGALSFAGQPREEDHPALLRAWREAQARP